MLQLSSRSSLDLKILVRWYMKWISHMLFNFDKIMLEFSFNGIRCIYKLSCFWLRFWISSNLLYLRFVFEIFTFEEKWSNFFLENWVSIISFRFFSLINFTLWIWSRLLLLSNLRQIEYVFDQWVRWYVAGLIESENLLIFLNFLKEYIFGVWVWYSFFH